MNPEQGKGDWKRVSRFIVLLFLLAATAPQYGCAAVAGGVVGGVIGHEIAEEDEDDE